eukprot:2467242-Pleurochrysis_carterae.AAC.2
MARFIRLVGRACVVTVLNMNSVQNTSLKASSTLTSTTDGASQSCLLNVLVSSKSQQGQQSIRCVCLALLHLGVLGTEPGLHEKSVENVPVHTARETANDEQMRLSRGGPHLTQSLLGSTYTHAAECRLLSQHGKVLPQLLDELVRIMMARERLRIRAKAASAESRGETMLA